MKIKNIQIDNLLAIKSINVDFPTPIAMFCGANGTMKSSIYDGVSMALAREPMRAVMHKKDYGQLVHDGSKAGGGFVEMDDGAVFEFNLPSGEFKGPEVTDAMRVSLNGQKFAQMDVKQRTKLLMEVAGIRPTKAVILPLLLVAAGGADEHTAAVLPLLAQEDYAAIAALDKALPATVLPKIHEITAQLRGGFEAAEKYAADRALESKRLWQVVTGRKAYGKDVAEAWQAEIPEVPAGDAAALRQQAAEQEEAITAANQAIGAIQQAADQSKADAAQRQQLEAAAGKVGSLRTQLELAEKDLAEYLPKVEALRERAKGKARVGLVHDMAKFIAGDVVAAAKDTGIKQAKLLAAYEKEYGALADLGRIDSEAQAALPEHESGLTVMQNRVSNLKRDLAASVEAKAKYDVLAPADEAVDASAELAEVQQLLETAKAEKQRLVNAALDIEAAHKNIAEAEQKNVDATKHHEDVTQWIFLKDQLSATGIPAQLLAKALEPINAMLKQAQDDTLWPAAVIRDDMEIIAGDRLYSLQSESFRWRADAMIAQTIATMSGVKILMLDRFDVLDMKGRVDLFEWLDIMQDAGDIETAMIFGTLKDLPASGLPASFTGYWVEGGNITKTASYDEVQAAA